MNLSIRQLEAESLQDSLAPTDPLAQAVYGLYQCRPAAAQKRRVVVLTGAGVQREHNRWAISGSLEIDTVYQVLWDALSKRGERIGEVVYNCAPAEGDYVIHCRDDGYHVAVAVDADEAILGVA